MKEKRTKIDSRETLNNLESGTSGQKPRTSTKGTNQKILKIRWQRLIFKKETCP
jgi:hypothetical protein